MTTQRSHALLASGGALFVALTVGGITMAATLPTTPAASASSVGAIPVARPDASGEATATTEATDGQGTQGSTVSAAAQSSLTGGAHHNHGGYVSCVARGGSHCTSATPTLPLRPRDGSHRKGS